MFDNIDFTQGSLWGTYPLSHSYLYRSLTGNSLCR